jgi:O-methyltransferase
VPVEQTTESTRLYLDLLKRSLTGALAEDNDSILGGVRTAGSTSLKRRAANAVGQLAGRMNIRSCTRSRTTRPNARLAATGRPGPSR